MAAQYALAVRLCPHFGRDVAPTLAALAGSAVNKLQRIQIVRSIEPVEATMPAAQGGCATFNIETGGF
jgi:hypothetical protein